MMNTTNSIGKQYKLRKWLKMQHRHPKGNSGLGCKVKLDEDTGKLNTSFRKIVCKIGVLVPGNSTLRHVQSRVIMECLYQHESFD